jgi:hypothetical protein
MAVYLVEDMVELVDSTFGAAHFRAPFAFCRPSGHHRRALVAAG